MYSGRVYAYTEIKRLVLRLRFTVSMDSPVSICCGVPPVPSAVFMTADGKALVTGRCPLSVYRICVLPNWKADDDEAHV